MEARRRWATGFVVIFAVASGVGGGAYLWKEAFPTGTEAGLGDGGAGDASAEAGRGKSKSAKKKKRKGRRRKGRSRSKPSGGNGNAGSGVAGGGNGNGNDNVNGQDDEGSADEVVEVFTPPFRGRGPAGPTYEKAIASNRQEVVMGGKSVPDLTDAQLAGPMHDGAFVDECGAPERMKVTVKVAIKMGRAAGVSVSTTPPDPDVAGCIDRYVRTFSWPSSGKMDSFITTY